MMSAKSENDGRSTGAEPPKPGRSGAIRSSPARGCRSRFGTIPRSLESRGSGEVPASPGRPPVGPPTWRLRSQGPPVQPRSSHLVPFAACECMTGPFEPPMSPALCRLTLEIAGRAAFRPAGTGCVPRSNTMTPRDHGRQMPMHPLPRGACHVPWKRSRGTRSGGESSLR